MAAWTDEQLAKIENTPDLYVSPYREYGTTYGTPTQTWALVVDGKVYVRAANGRAPAGIRRPSRRRPAASVWTGSSGPSRSSPPVPTTKPPSTRPTKRSTRAALPYRSCRVPARRRPRSASRRGDLHRAAHRNGARPHRTGTLPMASHPRPRVRLVPRGGHRTESFRAPGVGISLRARIGSSSGQRVRGVGRARVCLPATPSWSTIPPAHVRSWPKRTSANRDPWCTQCRASSPHLPTSATNTTRARRWL